jgi:hypothetical protein
VSAAGLERSTRTVPANLHDHDLGEVSRKDARATGRVQSLGTSAKWAPALRDPEWAADLEYVWRTRTHDELQRLDKRAKQQRRAAARARKERTPWARQKAVALSRSSEWAEHRAQAMALPRSEVLAACGKRFRPIRCGCGWREVPVGCDQTVLCERCKRRSWRKWRRKLVRALDAHVRSARSAWARHREGYLPGVYLVTLTIQHSGSIEADREFFSKAWRKLTKVAQRESWWSAYAATYEITPGTAGDGHVHLHVAAVSSWIPYDRLHEVWRAVSGARVLDVQAPSRSTKVSKAAEYLSKYVTKGVDPAVFTGQKAAELLCAVRGKRRITTSQDFWRPTRDREHVCATCGRKCVAVGAPVALRNVAPGAVLRALAERIGWWVPRGGVQAEMKGLTTPWRSQESSRSVF